MAGKYIGTLLVEKQILSQAQVDRILARQRETGEPFGATAVELYGVRMADVWRAVAAQQLETLPHVDVAGEAHEECALQMISPRQAWATKVLPLRVDGETLVCATTAKALPDAMALLHERLECPVTFVVAEELPLKQLIMQRLPMD